MFGYVSETEIICHQIYPKVDLIPHMGEINNIPEDMLRDFTKAKASKYDSIIFYLYPNEATKLKKIILSDSLEYTNQVIADLQL